MIGGDAVENQGLFQPTDSVAADRFGRKRLTNVCVGRIRDEDGVGLDVGLEAGGGQA